MEKLNLIKKYIKNHKKISEIPGCAYLKKLEDIELEEPLILRQNGNGKPIPRIKIIIPKEIKNQENIILWKGLFIVFNMILKMLNLNFQKKKI